MTKNKIDKVIHSIKNAIPKALKTSWWLIKLTIPVAFLVFCLDRTGIIQEISDFVEPFFLLLGLPAETALVLMTSILTNVYSVVAVLSTLALDFRETIVLALMCLISHAYIPETIIQKKVGSNAVTMIALRIGVSLIAGIGLNLILPEFSQQIKGIHHAEDAPFVEALITWVQSMMFLCMKIVGLITGLLILQNILNDFGIIKKLSKRLKPLMSLMGLPENTALSWFVANLIGLSYSSAILLEEVEHKSMTKEEANLLNYHIAISHSQLEDPLLFLPLGIPVVWLIVPRIVLAIAVVWLKKLYTHCIKRKNREGLSLQPK